MESSLSNHFKISIILGFIALLQCEKEVTPIPLESSQFQRVYIFDAKEFLSVFSNDSSTFNGLIAKIKDNNLIFEKVLSVDGQFTRLLTSNQPSFSIIGINREKKQINLDASNINNYPLEPESSKFDFAYFSWPIIESMALHSKNIYISGVVSTYGSGIHSDVVVNEIGKNNFFTLKLEADCRLKKSDEKLETRIPFPMIALGTPCPPTWTPL